jgi:type VI secretion system protein ImpF
MTHRYPVPLLERLSNDAEASLDGQDALVESIAKELARLMNTRSHLTMAAFGQSDGTVIDYGVPDFSERALRSGEDREVIAGAIGRAIALFEPRLADVKVSFSHPEEHDRFVVLTIAGTVNAGLSVEHVSFELETAGREALDRDAPGVRWKALA